MTFGDSRPYTRKAELLRRADQVPSTSLPFAQQDGSRRAVFTRIKGTNFHAGTNELGAGQSSPPHSFDAEHIIVLLSGSIDWTVDGVVYRLRRRYDMLFIPAYAEYSPRNPGARAAQFLSIAGRVAEWPGRASYHDGSTYTG